MDVTSARNKLFSRRRFLAATAGVLGWLENSRAGGDGETFTDPMDLVRDFLRGFILTRSSIDRFLDPSARVPGPDLSSPDTLRRSVTALYHAYAVRVGIKIVERLHSWLSAREKKLMVLLSHPMGSVWHHCTERTQGDPDFIDWHPEGFRGHLEALGIPYVNTVEQHLADFRQFNLSARQYVDRYYIGHYNPAGNHFFAYAIREALLEWLDPKPPAYRAGDEALIRFEGYLPR